MAAEVQPPVEQDASAPAAEPIRAATGIAGLEAVLGGGLLCRRMYVIEGAAGAGKTTLALQFMLAGRAHHERGLWITTNETPDELQGAAHAHGWSLEGIDVVALSMAEYIARPEQQQTLFRPSHVELDETMQAVLAALEGVQPGRVAFDSLSILRDMAAEPFAYRRQVLALKNAVVALWMHGRGDRRVAGDAGHALAHGGPRRDPLVAGGDHLWQRAAAGGNREDAGDARSRRPS
jgi:predicted ATPase